MSEHLQHFNIGNFSGDLTYSDSVFEPNLTTKMLAESAEIKEGDRVLELGCGVGPLAIYAAKQGAREVCAIDVMEEACHYARKNVELNGVADRVHIYHGNLFEPVKGEKFDVIIDDVSGMSEAVSRISPWYPMAIPSGGYDGTELTIKMLAGVREHLNDAGRLYFPLVSLSDSSKILAAAMDVFGNGVEAINEKMVPFCNEFKQKIMELEALKQEGIIDFVRRRSRYLWRLTIYYAHV